MKKAGSSPEVTIAIHCIDLQRFTEINDTLGHPVGDALLKAAATRLTSPFTKPISWPASAATNSSSSSNARARSKKQQPSQPAS